MLSFSNTKIAFASKSNQDLKHSYWLFKIISNNGFVAIGSAFTSLAIKFKLPITGLIKATIFRQFCGGETLEECEAKINELGQSRIGTILDYSVEGKDSENDFDACVKETIATIQKSITNNHIPFCVFKVTGIARFDLLQKVASNIILSEEEQKEFQRIEKRVNAICKAAYSADTPIFIDAEESWIQNTIDDLALDMMRRYNDKKAIVYNTIQMYRKDRLDYLKRSFEIAKTDFFFIGFKIVRGAYMDKERERAREKGYSSPIQDNKQNTDNDYDSAISFCVENTQQIAFCAATHNEDSCMKLTERMADTTISKNHKHIYFAQLLGMSDHISYNLADAGYNVAKYVPYGPVKEVVPYLIRRAQENTFVKGQVGRELSLIIKEMERRRSEK